MAMFRIVSSVPFPPSMAPALVHRHGQYESTELNFEDEREYLSYLMQLQSHFGGQESLGICPADFKPAAVFYDMDATVIAQESLVEIAKALGKGDEVAQITDRAMAGEMDFKAALLARLALIKGRSAAVLDEVAARLTLNPGIEAFLVLCAREHIPVYLVSGGFNQLAGPLARRLGLRGYKANQLGVRDGKLTGDIDGEIVDAAVKDAFVQQTCEELGYEKTDAVVVGDGANDLQMIRGAGLGVGFRAKPVLWSATQVYIGNGDHRFLAPLLFPNRATLDS